MCVVFRGTIDDCELVDGLVLTQKVANTGVTRVEKAKIGLIQFCLSPPKTDVSQQIQRKDNSFLLSFKLRLIQLWLLSFCTKEKVMFSGVN